MKGGGKCMIKVKEDMTGWNMWEHGVPESKLTVMKQIEDYVTSGGERCSQWLCICNCKEHNEVKARGKDLKSGDKTSCGCMTKELLRLGAKKYNKYDLSKEYGVGWTRNTNKEFYFDLEDYDKIKDYCWYEHVDHNGYNSIQANDSELGSTIRMHWIIVGKHYDHKDRNTFNNRKSNLRLATATENAQNRSIYKNNTSGFTGVSWDKVSCKWKAQIQYHKKKIALGLFDNKEDAIKTRLKAEAKYFGEFAPQRHLFEEYGINILTIQN
jgi:hypothetical protein